MTTTAHHIVPSRSSRLGRPVEVVTTFLGALVVVSGLAGLLVPDVYTGDRATVETLRAWDAVGIPLGLALLVAVRRARVSVIAHVLALSLVSSLVYTTAYYAFGTGFNDLFLAHVAIFGTGLAALVLLVSELEPAALAARLAPHARPRLAGGLLAALALGLGAMWVVASVDNAVTGAVPAGSLLVESETVVRLGIVLDLALLVPLYALAAVLLWRRARWGWALGVVAVVSGLIHQLDYVVAMPFQVAADVEGAVAYDPAEPVVILCYVVAAWALLRGLRYDSVEG